ncbi:DUF4381 domain-containing protein [Vibrio kyushuensis]|uniref:DUF4381 domain-containing protein n=1 Tax=Vibrio TaxID=662 RepID=UPI003D107E95
MSNNNILLKNLIEPSARPSIDWFPSTIGWKCLLIVLVAAVIWGGYRCYTRLKSESYRRKAIKALNQIPFTHPTALELQSELRRFNSVVKHVACFAYPNSRVAMLTGQSWVDFLYKTTSNNDLDSSLLERWQSELYQLKLVNSWEVADLNRLRILCITWVRTHDRSDYDRV